MPHDVQKHLTPCGTHVQEGVAIFHALHKVREGNEAGIFAMFPQYKAIHGKDAKIMDACHIGS
ncbi:hypothetical protein [Nitratidesulfovibrio sp.]|uniref:hypothetical protein n=1 Tax=Nitratidesulfovibrio sp. TaxID=2802297 RepID=UPI0033420D1D